MNTIKMNASVIGTRLRMLRGDKTLEIVSADTGISRSALNMYELGNRIPRDDVKIRIANYYGSTVDAIFFSGTSHNE